MRWGPSILVGDRLVVRGSGPVLTLRLEGVLPQAEVHQASLEAADWPVGSSRLRARLQLGLIALVLLLAASFTLGSRLVFDPDEGRNAETMLEMARSGDFVVPHLDGLPFLDKPLIFFAAGGLSILLLGATETAVRLPALLSTVATLLLVGAFARRWLGRSAGTFAALGFAATPLVLAYAQIVIFDAMLTFWITAAIFAFHRAVEAEAGEPRFPWAHLAWAAIALGILTKGPVALLVPLAAVGPWAAWRRRFGRLWRRGAPFVLLLPVVPWVWAILERDPEFLRYVLFTETLSRLSSDELNRDAPIWYYLPILLLGGLPWSLVPLAGWRDLREAWRRREPTVIFLLCWFLVPLLPFSFMHSKRPHYILPILPALVLLAVWIWSRRDGDRPLPGARAAGIVWGALGLLSLAVGVGAAPTFLDKLDLFGPREVGRVLLGVGAVWLVAGLLAWVGRRSPRVALLAFSLPLFALSALSAPLVAEVGRDRSAHALAREIATANPPGIEVVGIETMPPSLAFYLGRTITLASADGGPLRSNYLLRRYQGLVDVEPTLRSPAWLATALLDCATPRLFLVRQRHKDTHEVLEGLGRRTIFETRQHRLYGGCAEAGATAPAPASTGATTEERIE